MKRYNLYCSEELTYTAALLGAPMEETWDNTMPRIVIDGEYYRIPTIEQICGFLREKEIYISVTTNKAITVTSVTANEEYHNFKDKTYEQAMKKAIDRALYILQKQNKEKNIREETTKERKGIMSDGRPPFCGNRKCGRPRTKFNGTQFICPECGWTTKYDKEFIERYRKKWNK